MNTHMSLSLSSPDCSVIEHHTEQSHGHGLELFTGRDRHYYSYLLAWLNWSPLWGEKCNLNNDSFEISSKYQKKNNKTKEQKQIDTVRLFSKNRELWFWSSPVKPGYYAQTHARLDYDGFLVSKETVVLRRWERWKQKFLVLSNELIKVELPPWKI